MCSASFKTGESLKYSQRQTTQILRLWTPTAFHRSDSRISKKCIYWVLFLRTAGEVTNCPGRGTRPGTMTNEENDWE